MKIVDITTTTLHYPNVPAVQDGTLASPGPDAGGRSHLFVHIKTDEDVEGFGVGQASPGSVQLIETVLKQILIEQDPFDIERLWSDMFWKLRTFGSKGIASQALSAVDIGLWDLKAKLAGEPLWRLLGAKDRFVTGYASGLDIALTNEQLHDFYTLMGERGFQSGKLKGGRDASYDLKRLAIVADALRRNCPTPALMLDANESWNLKQAVRYLHRIEQEIDLAWIEEPLRRWDASGHARLSGAIRAAVATGENLTGLEQFRPLFDANGVDVVQAGAVWGITHFLRVAVAAHSRDLPVSPVGLTANYAVTAAAAAVPNHLSSEIQDLSAPFGVDLDQSIEDGGVVLGDKPGVGVEIDEAAIVAHQRDASWLSNGGPHVRSHRAGLRLITHLEEE